MRSRCKPVRGGTAHGGVLLLDDQHGDSVFAFPLPGLRRSRRRPHQTLNGHILEGAPGGPRHQQHAAFFLEVVQSLLIGGLGLAGSIKRPEIAQGVNGSRGRNTQARVPSRGIAGNRRESEQRQADQGSEEKQAQTHEDAPQEESQAEAVCHPVGPGAMPGQRVPCDSMDCSISVASDSAFVNRPRSVLPIDNRCAIERSLIELQARSG